MRAKYVHTNLIARNWRMLAGFYESVFGCVPVPPERDLSGPAIDDATAIHGARIRGMHLRLPGYGEDAPTLEIFEYTPSGADFDTAVNRPGFGHIAFLVDDVAEALREVLAAGGKEYGSIASVAVGGAGVVTFVYVADPEGNIIELQSWRQIETPLGAV